MEERGQVKVVRIDRPPANALDLELLAEGRQLVDELARETPGAVVVTGREGFFSAGIDLKLAPTLDQRGQRAMVNGVNGLFAAWYGFPRPVVCAVNGHAIAGGLILALCGDYRVASGEGRLGLTEVRAGIGYPAVAMAVVKAELSPAVARRLVLGGGLVDVGEALALGLVDELAESEALLDRAVEVAEGLANLPRAAYARVKRDLRAETLEAAERIVSQESDPLLDSWLGEETAEAAARTLEG